MLRNAKIKPERLRPVAPGATLIMGWGTWSPSDTRQIITMLKDNPTTAYIYPESRDIDTVAHATAARQSLSRANLYWNASCLTEIGSPKFRPRQTLEPILAQ